MRILTEKVRVEPELSEPEDILQSGLSALYPDDVVNQHGDRDQWIVYSSETVGEVRLELGWPDGEKGRLLFAHYLWNSGLQLAEFVEEGDREWFQESVKGKRKGEEEWVRGEEKRGREGRWDVVGERVIEVGAGTGLVGIMCGLMGAQEVVITDYPDPKVINNLKVNVKNNGLGGESKAKSETEAQAGDQKEEVDKNRDGEVEEKEEKIVAEKEDGKGEEIELTGDVKVIGHEWGALDDDFSLENKGKFSRVISADCLWMPWQHENLLKSIDWFLADDGRAWVIAGLHTGREKMCGFFEEERLKKMGLEIEFIYERDANGVEREWVVDRGREDPISRKRWLVIAGLRRVGR